MGKCDLCVKCDRSKCPKTVKIRGVGDENIRLPETLADKLRRLCAERGFIKGEDYYKVADFNRAIDYLINEHGKRVHSRRRLKKIGRH